MADRKTYVPKYNGMNDDLLNYAVESGKIDIAQIQLQYDISMRAKILEQYPHKIWQAKNGRWYTYYYEDGKRKQVTRKTKEAIEDFIVNLTNDENVRVVDVYKEWYMKKRAYEEVCGSTLNRYEVDWRRYFSEFGKLHIKDITEADIEDFAKATIKGFNLTNKSWANCRTLLYGVFRLAKKKGLVQFNIQEVVSSIGLPKNFFAKNYKDDAAQVFLPDEEEKIMKYCTEHPDTVNLGIMLLFKSGLRIGELTALKWCDIDGNTIHVQRTEATHLDEKTNRFIVKVKDHPKTDAGNRLVYLPSDSGWILKRLRQLSPFSEYVLSNQSGKRHTNQSVRSRLYRVCDWCGVARKSPHKIRKTYGTKLYDSKLPDGFVCSQMGHTDISCLQKYYYYHLFSQNEGEELINKVIDL